MRVKKGVKIFQQGHKKTTITAVTVVFVTPSGLRLYDGKTFTHFKDGLINPWIWTILEDKNGNIWVGTRDEGLYLFDGKTFINYTENKQ